MVEVVCVVDDEQLLSVVTGQVVAARHAAARPVCPSSVMSASASRARNAPNGMTCSVAVPTTQCTTVVGAANASARVTGQQRLADTVGSEHRHAGTLRIVKAAATSRSKASCGAATQALGTAGFYGARP